MGFNPYRKYRAGTTDIVLLVAGFAVAIGLVVWAFLG